MNAHDQKLKALLSSLKLNYTKVYKKNKITVELK